MMQIYFKVWVACNKLIMGSDMFNEMENEGWMGIAVHKLDFHPS
jgi:hypothetical protein